MILGPQQNAMGYYSGACHCLRSLKTQIFVSQAFGPSSTVRGVDWYEFPVSRATLCPIRAMVASVHATGHHWQKFSFWWLYAYASLSYTPILYTGILLASAADITIAPHATLYSLHSFSREISLIWLSSSLAQLLPPSRPGYLCESPRQLLLIAISTSFAHMHKNAPIFSRRISFHYLLSLYSMPCGRQAARYSMPLLTADARVMFDYLSKGKSISSLF